MNRRTLALGTILAAGIMVMTSIAPVVAADHPAVTFTRKVANDLLAANRSGTITSFARVLRRHADIPGISIYSLGKYERFLRSSQNQRLLQWCHRFHGPLPSRIKPREYRVAKAEVLNAKQGSGSDIAVNTLVTLLTGNKYTVQFLLRPKGKSFKISDVKVSVPILGFVSLTYQQRGIFQKFLVKKGGDQRAVSQLVETLNR